MVWSMQLYIPPLITGHDWSRTLLLHEALKDDSALHNAPSALHIPLEKLYWSLASFPGHRRNGYAISASSNRIWVTSWQLQYLIETV